jgi:predicted site-specific integrase-resolvase
MKLSQYAKHLGLTYRTVWNYYKQGKIPNAYELPSGTIIVPDDIIKNESKQENKIKKVCIYARVSSSQNKTNLNAQAERLEKYCTANGWQIVRTIKEIASGLNDKRTQLADIISKIHDYDYVVIEHKDRLTRVGFNYFEMFYPNKFHVINLTKDETEDLMQDLVSIITSFCARLYGQRRGKRKTEKLIKELQNHEEEK